MSSGLVIVLTGVLVSVACALLGAGLSLRRQRLAFAADTLVLHRHTHAHTADERAESAVTHLSSALRWAPAFAQQTIQRAVAAGLVRRANGQLALTEPGWQSAEEALIREETLS